MTNLLMGEWMTYFNAGKKVFQCTYTPITTSTDSWTTVNGQTVVASESVRVQLNNWFYTLPFPLSGVIPLCEAVGTGTNYSLWQTNLTTDGLHPDGTSELNGRIIASNLLSAGLYKTLINTPTVLIYTNTIVVDAPTTNYIVSTNAAVNTYSASVYAWAMKDIENPGSGSGTTPAWWMFGGNAFARCVQLTTFIPFIAPPVNYLWNGTNFVWGETVGTTNAFTWTESCVLGVALSDATTNTAEPSATFNGSNTSPAGTNIVTYWHTNVISTDWVTNTIRATIQFYRTIPTGTNMWLFGGFLRTYWTP
jgi:hypothetical protein